jgi:hypothetical protein
VLLLTGRSPYSTDPDAPRVRDMVMHYEKLPFVDDDDKFNDLTIYIRKPLVHSDSGKGIRR